jgi:DNA-binding beta-propeller fold protein YncE
MGRKSGQILIVALLSLFTCCVKDKPADTSSSSASGSVYVVCEGSFGSGNAALYSLNTATNAASGDLYYLTNHKYLGDVFQSMKRIEDKLFLCINNSDKIEVLSVANLQNIGAIQIPKPRYILPVSNAKAYVSSLYTNKLYIVNPQSLQLTDSVVLPYYNTEQMCLYNGNVIACPWDTSCNKVYVIDPSTDRVMQELAIGGYAPQAVLVDKEQMLWVLSGNKTKGRTAAWTRIDPSTANILATYNFPVDADPLKPAFNKTKDTLYFIEVNYYGGTSNNGVYRMGIHETALPLQPFIAAGQYQYFWGLGIDPVSNNLFIGDPKGFTQKGTVYIYQPDGKQSATFTVGIGPGAFYFGE